MKIYIVDLESIPSRYTSEWKTTVPEGFANYIKTKNINASVETIEGRQVEEIKLNGAFLDFAATNIYKSTQVEKLAELIRNQKIVDGDYILFTDFWHPGVHNLRYMLDLFNIKARVGGLVHAGSHDPNDFLGRIEDKRWIVSFENALYEAFDDLYFATEDHINQYLTYFKKKRSDKIVRTGWPLDYVKKLENNIKKEKLILFPHRIAPEKQLDIFKDLEKSLPEYKFFVCQEHKLSKQEYHELLKQSSLVFSASLQETLGISQIEAIFAGAFSMVPDRLSYKEMYLSLFKYKSDWTIDYNSYLHNKYAIIQNIHTAIRLIENGLDFSDQKELLSKYITPTEMYNRIFHG